MREKESSVERETSPTEQDPPPAKPHKKQVRRRLQTRKPYHEKLLNMAEARREIVTALKLHRAAMKQATQNQQHQTKSAPDFQTDQKSRRNPRICASNSDVNFSERNAVYSPNFYSWPVHSTPLPPPPVVFEESIDFQLPSQALGLNLNLQDFITASSSSIYSSSPSTAAAGIPSGGDEKFEFLNCGGEDEREEELASSPFDEVMEFPPWLNANESCYDHVPDYFQGPVLPCLEIEEIEGMEGDWLA